VLRWNEKAERIKAKVQYLAFASSFASCVGDALITWLYLPTTLNCLGM
jgi:hypothetical protein